MEKTKTNERANPLPLIRVMIVDDHPLAQSGLQTMIKSAEDLELVAMATDGASALSLYQRHKPDVVLMDVLLPKLDGVMATGAICTFDSHARVLMLSSTGDAALIERALRAGASGYLIKHATADEIIQAIRHVCGGRSALSPDAQESLLRAIQYGGVDSGDLNERELAVLRLVAQGRNNQEIGDVLGLSRSTVKYYLARVFTKFGVESRSAAIAVAYERRLLIKTE